MKSDRSEISMSNLQPRFLSKARNSLRKKFPQKSLSSAVWLRYPALRLWENVRLSWCQRVPPRGENLRVWHGFSTFGGTDGVSPWGIAVGEKPTERYCTLSEMAKAYEVMTRLVCLLEPLEKWKGWKGWGPFVSPSL